MVRKEGRGVVWTPVGGAEGHSGMDAASPYWTTKMTPLTYRAATQLQDDVLAGPETFEAPTVTVVEGLKITPHVIEGNEIPGIVTIFRLGGDSFGEMHELQNLREHEGRLSGWSEQPVETGALVTIGWEDSTRIACQGVVALSMRTANGWRVTIDLNSALAA